LLLLMAGAAAGGAPIAAGAPAARASSIEGQVVDAMGQPVPGVRVTAIPQSGGPARHATSEGDGAYRFAMLPEGLYRVDFDLPGFDLVRRNGVRVGSVASAGVDATLQVSSLCDCIDTLFSATFRQRAGQVVDENGAPLPHARLEVLARRRREVACADAEGRFLLRAPDNESWRLSASDTGFRRATRRISMAAAGPIVIKLTYAGATDLPDTERLTRGCRCPGDLFTHAGR
jgi:hypothetical protein